MTYEEAMRLIENDKTRELKVRRPHWKRREAVGYFEHYDDEHFYDDAHPVEWLPTLWSLDNVHGWNTGVFGEYDPTAEDKEATDWEIYDRDKLYPPSTEDGA